MESINIDRYANVKRDTLFSSSSSSSSSSSRGKMEKAFYSKVRGLLI